MTKRGHGHRELGRVIEGVPRNVCKKPGKGTDMTEYLEDRAFRKEAATSKARAKLIAKTMVKPTYKFRTGIDVEAIRRARQSIAINNGWKEKRHDLPDLPDFAVSDHD